MDAGVDAHDPGAQHPPRTRLEQQLRHPVRPPQAQRPTRDRPRDHGLLVLDAVVAVVIEDIDHVIHVWVTRELLQLVDRDHPIVVQVEGAEGPVLVAEEISGR